jgi:hypothetical protein
MDYYILDFSDELLVLLLGVLAVAVALIAPQMLGYHSLKKFPFTGGQYGSYPKRLIKYLYHAESLYLEGYAKFNNAAYRMTTADGTPAAIG